eukprot:CAMPEP_0113942932 /NCGR_PEP_ID=MMETSP1339-20121228/14959_1 /TAXON_ID=94617 /ORGANISM="Fibrocapsa japonica" /LENGTH=196 /DNA_ID=CAMNT_0000947623 /DNA_START=172 /DNA_END=762 /DNA_ORIENTATION=- /assembly_acc=CAM_ASM_000762
MSGQMLKVDATSQISQRTTTVKVGKLAMMQPDQGGEIPHVQAYSTMPSQGEHLSEYKFQDNSVVYQHSEGESLSDYKFQDDGLVYQASGVRTLANGYELQNVIANTGNQLVVVKFYASSCRLCKQLDFHYKQLPQEYPGVLFCEINNVGNEEVFRNAVIDSLPTLLFFRGPSMMIDRMRYKFQSPTDLRLKIASLN